MGTSLLRDGTRLVLICGVLCSIFGASLLFGFTGDKQGENEVLAIGTGKVFSGNLASAKKNAISQALVKGVESYLVRRLGSQNVVNNFERLIQEIIPAAENDIENFNILAEYQIGDKYQVLVRLRINEKVIDKRLGEAGLTMTKGLPIKLLFMVSENSQGVISYWWKDPEIDYALNPTELALHKSFQKRGFSPINRTLNVPEAVFSEELRVVDLEDYDIIKWGRMFSADVVIFGRTEILEEKGLSLALKAFDVKRDFQIYQDMEIETIDRGLDSREAMIMALERLADRLAETFTPAIIRTSALDQDRIRKIEITLMGLNSYKQFMTFMDFLRKQVMDVQSVRQIRIRKNSITIEVEFRGDRYRFLDHVLNHENLPFPLNLAETEERNI
ncbi:hypothetical protein DRN98_09920, partial [Methanosarcinales archaeon]